MTVKELRDALDAEVARGNGDLEVFNACDSDGRPVPAEVDGVKVVNVDGFVKVDGIVNDEWIWDGVDRTVYLLR